MRNVLYLCLWFIIGLLLTFSLGCATVQHTKVSACGIQNGIQYSVEHTLEY